MLVVSYLRKREFLIIGKFIYCSIVSIWRDAEVVLFVKLKVLICRLCRARRVIENIFGILAARWRIYRKPIIASNATVVAIIKATVCLHNFLMDDKQYFTSSCVDRENNEGEIIDGDWRRDENVNLPPVGRTSTNMYGRQAEKMRESLTRYFMNEGSVPFQWNK